ncbi:MAG TPA: transposase, partial [Casimicrobiaceae bacterium]|nr:transposase [Casimicrobiaceae bacterium]
MATPGSSGWRATVRTPRSRWRSAGRSWPKVPPAKPVEWPAEGHLRRPFYQFFESTRSPLAAHVLACIRELYTIEAKIRGHPAEHRREVRQARSRPIVEALHAWLQEHVPRVSGVSELAKAMR